MWVTFPIHPKGTANRLAIQLAVHTATDRPVEWMVGVGGIGRWDRYWFERHLQDLAPGNVTVRCEPQLDVFHDGISDVLPCHVFTPEHEATE